MMIIGAVAAGTSIFLLWLFDWCINVLTVFMFAWTIFAFIGGILCLMRRHWGVCLASAIAAVVLGIFGVPLAGVGWGIPGFLAGIVGFPLVLAGGIASTVFISRRKKEWQEISA